MEEKEDIKIEELFSYGMSKEGFEKLLLDIQNAVSEVKESINCEKLLEGSDINEENKLKLREAVAKANESIDENLTDIEEVFNRIVTDFEKEKGDTNE